VNLLLFLLERCHSSSEVQSTDFLDFIFSLFSFHFFKKKEIGGRNECNSLAFLAFLLYAKLRPSGDIRDARHFGDVRMEHGRKNKSAQRGNELVKQVLVMVSTLTIYI